MEINEIKKALYKLKPIAERVDRTTTKEGETYHLYKTYISPGGEGRLYFNIPESEMGEKIFQDLVPAQLLIRWLSNIQGE